ncbi:MAG: dTDP-4-dehydrorhamnose 3,5-epimerase family protein [bacterium]
MKLIKTAIEGVCIIRNLKKSDIRGAFTKIFNEDSFKEANLAFEFKESFYSINKKNVIRGMHFQKPPHDHEKLIYVPQGNLLDVLLDLRKKSKTFGEYITISLSDKDNKSIYIPKGLAHGFKSLKENTIMIYNVTSVYNSKSDSGIRFDSFGFDWNTEDAIISSRDLSLPPFSVFNLSNPF